MATLRQSRINSSGSATLVSHFSYFDTGNVSQAYDPNGAITAYIYGNTAQGNSTISCGNSFPTSVNLPVNSMTTYTTWNCIGGVATASTDANLQSALATYNDHYFWRPASVQDPATNITTLSYPGTTPPFSRESSLTFGSSISENLATVDSFGRLILSQRQQGPSSLNYDSTQTNYDILGRPYQDTVPFVGAKAQTTSSAPVVTTAYDALGRVTKVSDANGGFVSNAYAGNDVLQVTGSGSGTLKQKQLEYDGLGRLASVCEVTAGNSLSPASSCPQQTALPSPGTAYVTTYAYTASGSSNTTTVTQNGQTRTYVYDLLGRLVQATNPESGVSQYFYDTAAAGCTAWGLNANYPGDLVGQYDQIGNTACFAYDALHRLVGTWFFGPNTTPSKHFVYDAASVNGVSMTNAKGRLAEAFTCTYGVSSCVGNVIADELFGYSSRGELTDVYESTPHSGGYYHTTASYWPNGAVNTLGGVPGLSSMSFTPDGEGRPTSTTYGTTHWVSSTAFNAASQPTNVTFGKGDTDVYGYDGNTGRMNSFQFNLGSTVKSLTGTPGWNANRSLGSLNITDQFNTSNVQNCTYMTHLTRPVLEGAGGGRFLCRRVVPLSPSRCIVAVVLQHICRQRAALWDVARVPIPIVRQLRDLPIADAVMIPAGHY